MTQVVYGQKGYLGSSMSVRAAEAYEQSEMPISRWTKTAIIQAVKDYCFDFDLAYDPDIENNTKAELVKEFLEYKSWHHSSRSSPAYDRADHSGSLNSTYYMTEAAPARTTSVTR